MFQFHMVRLKVFWALSPEGASFVSIPYGTIKRATHAPVSFESIGFNSIWYD